MGTSLRTVHFIVYDGIRFHQMRNGYYKSSRRGLLHRYVWERERGPIPDGWNIHHRFNGDKATTDPARLECIPSLQHQHEHPRAYEWHRDGARASWAQRERVRLVCPTCGIAFEAHRDGRIRFCSDRCRERNYAATGTGRPHERRLCAVCGAGFDTRADRSIQTCSRHCTAVLAYRARRASL